MKDRRIHAFWRKSYELHAALFWFLGALVALLYGIYGDFGFRFLLLVSIPLAFIGSIRLFQANRLLYQKAKTHALPDIKISIDDVMELQRKNPDRAFVGFGNTWSQTEVQRAYDYTSRDKNLFDPGGLYLWACKAMGTISSFRTASTYLHAVAKDEEPLFIPLESRSMHRLISGGSGSGKGTVVIIDIICALVRKETVILVDPKYDKRMLDVIWYVMAKMDRQRYCYYFNPSYPSSSVRLDLLSGYGNLAQVATRIVNIMPPSNDVSFHKFAWRALFAIVSALSLMNQKITLLRVRECIQQPMSYLVKEAGVYYFNSFEESKEMAVQIQGTVDSDKAAEMVLTGYYTLLHEAHPSKEMVNLFGLYQQDQRHYQKLIQNIIPDLTVLTSGNLGPLLSPYSTDGDPRPIVTLSMIAKGRAFLYVSLSSLTDTSASTSLGALLLNASAQLVGDRYFYPDESSESAQLNIYIDEASEVLNDASIQLLNKSRGSGTAITLLTQELGGIEKRLGTKAAVEMVTSNTDNKTLLRSVDESSAMYFSGQSGTTTVATMDYTLNTNSTTNQSIDFTTSYGKNIRHVEHPRVSPVALGDLPNLHFFMLYEASTIVKGRVPYLLPPEGVRFENPKFGPTIFGELPAFDALSQSRNYGASYADV